MDLLEIVVVEESTMNGIAGFMQEGPAAKGPRMDKSAHLAVTTARLLLGVAARTRALENANYECVLGQERKTQIGGQIKEVGEKWDVKLKIVIGRGEKITPAAPIHRCA